MRRALLSLLLCLPALIGPASSHGLAAGSQAARFVPFTGTAEVRYTRLPWYTLPTSAAAYAGQYDLLIHFAMRDPEHFRVDTQTITPALESGTRTMIFRGKSLLVYDTRTETAARSTIALPGATLFPGVTYRSILLSTALGGGAPVLAGPLPTTIASVKAYVGQLRRVLRSRYPPEYPPSFARVVGQDVVAGRPAVVVQYGPLDITDTITGCSFKHPGHCVHHYQHSGSEKLWIDRVHPFVLESRIYAPGEPRPFVSINGASFQVTGITFGAGPSAGDLAFVPPVPVRRVRNWSSLLGWSTSGGSGTPDIPRPFIPFTQPAQLSTDEGYQTYGSGPGGPTTEVDFLFSDGRHAPGPGGYITGAYLFVQEHVQAHGLPAALQTGTPATAGTCPVWTGTYPSGERWLAFAKGRVSLLVSTNALSRKQLIAYVSQQACK